MDVVGYSMASGLESKKIDLFSEFLPELPYGKFNCGCCFVEDILYVIGGSDVDYPNRNSILLYNLKTNTWTQTGYYFTDFKYKKTHCIEHNNNIIVLCENKMKLYNIKSNSLTDLATPKFNYNDPIQVAVKYNNAIYCISARGYVEKYDISANIWIDLTGKNFTNSVYLSGCLVNNFIYRAYPYYAYGYGVNMAETIIDKYNLNDNTTTEIFRIPNISIGSGNLINADGKLYLIGGIYENASKDAGFSSPYIIEITENSYKYAGILNNSNNNFTSVYKNGIIYTVGGSERSSFLINSSKTFLKTTLNYKSPIKNIENLKSWLVTR